MIYIYQGQQNQSAAVCSRNATINNPIFLWSLRHKLSNLEWNFIPFRVVPDTDYKPGYDVFCIDVDDSIPEVLTGTTLCGQTNVHLIPGEYDLSVYQQTSNTNITPSLSQGVIYKTLVNVVGVNQNIPITYSGQADNYVIYDYDNAES